MAFAMKVTGQGKLASVVQDLGTIPARLMPKMLDDAGRYMVRTHLPEVFSSEGALIGQKWPESNRGGQTLSDTSTLRRSFTHAVQGSRLVVATPVPYAAVHNDGDGNGGDYVQVPKNAKKLAIPLPTLSVSERRTGALLAKSKAKRKELGTFVAESKNGNLIIFQRKTNGEIRPLYLLVDKVVIPRRTFLTWSELAQNEIMERWSDALIAEANRTGVN